MTASYGYFLRLKVNYLGVLFDTNLHVTSLLLLLNLVLSIYSPYMYINLRYAMYVRRCSR